jgi:hypothetical protein
MIPVRFEEGIEAAVYLDELKNYRSLVRRLITEANPDPSRVEALTKATVRYPAPVRATAMTEDWCGDSALNLPLLSKLFAGAGIEFRVFHGSEQPVFEKQYHDRGIDHIPAVTLWDGNGTEIGTWIEAPQAVTEKKNEWKAARPEFMELYAKQKSDKDAAKRFATLYREFLEEMAIWYSGGLWDETAREIVELAGSRPA